MTFVGRSTTVDESYAQAGCSAAFKLPALMPLSSTPPVIERKNEDAAGEDSMKPRKGEKRAAGMPSVATLFNIKKSSNLPSTLASSISNGISALCFRTNISTRVPLNVIPTGLYKMIKTGSSNKVDDGDIDEEFIYVNVMDLSGEIDLKFASRFEEAVRRKLVVGRPCVIMQYVVQKREQKIGAVSRHNFVLAFKNVSEENFTDVSPEVAGQLVDMQLRWISLYELDWSELVIYNIHGFVKEVFDNRYNPPGYSKINKIFLSFAKDVPSSVRDAQVCFNAPTRDIILPFLKGTEVWISNLVVRPLKEKSNEKSNVLVLATTPLSKVSTAAFQF